MILNESLPTNPTNHTYWLPYSVYTEHQSHARVSFCVPYPNRGKNRACTGTRTRTRRIWSLPAVEPRIFFGVSIRVNCIHRAKAFCWYRLWVSLRVPTTPSTYCALYGRRCAKTRGRVKTWKFTLRTRTRALISLPVPELSFLYPYPLRDPRFRLRVRVNGGSGTRAWLCRALLLEPQDCTPVPVHILCC